MRYPNLSDQLGDQAWADVNPNLQAPDYNTALTQYFKPTSEPNKTSFQIFKFSSTV